ncbi:hypothetical protein LTS08_003074 [Lithohypha guttulata]|nr:hypothetical protein LTS08_003074 [Lithohypha guttulata]
MTTVANTALPDVDMDPLGKEREINAADVDDNTEPHLDYGSQPLAHQNAQKRYERLIAIRLALQFMLQLRTARTNLYNHTPDYDKSVLWGTTIPEADQPRKEELNRRLGELIHTYRIGDVHVPDFITSYIQLISEYKLGPSSERYAEMMRVFSDVTHNTPMAVMCENALWECHQPLHSYTIANIIYRHGNDVDAARLQEFLSRMVLIDSFPKSRVRWFTANVNDVRIAIPSTKNAYLLTALVRTTLMNRQQTIAEAYATAFFRLQAERHIPGEFKWYLIACFLQGYGEWATWAAGKRWLEVAVMWAVDIWQRYEYMLGRVVLRMLDFCVACDCPDEYEMILQAAIASSLPLPTIDTSKALKFSERMSQIRLDWIRRIREVQGDAGIPKRITVDNIRHFQQLLAGKFDGGRKITGASYDPIESKLISDNAVQLERKMGLGAIEKRLPLNNIDSQDMAETEADSNVAESFYPISGPLEPLARTQEEGAEFTTPFFPTSQPTFPTQSGAWQSSDLAVPAVASASSAVNADIEDKHSPDPTPQQYDRTFSTQPHAEGVPSNRRGYSSLAWPFDGVYHYVAKLQRADEKAVELERKLSEAKTKLAIAGEMAGRVAGLERELSEAEAKLASAGETAERVAGLERKLSEAETKLAITGERAERVAGLERELSEAGAKLASAEEMADVNRQRQKTLRDEHENTIIKHKGILQRAKEEHAATLRKLKMQHDYRRRLR